MDKIVPHILSEYFGERICYVVDKVRFITVIVLYMYVVIIIIIYRRKCEPLLLFPESS